MKRLLVVVCFVAAGIGGMQSIGSAQAAGNSAAAHACQQGGYLNLVSSDGASFASVGQCVSYAAQGGTFGVPGPTCTFGVDSGCVTLSTVSVPFVSDSGLGTLSLTGSYTFSPTSAYCPFTGASCGLASGSGTYTVAGGSFNGGTSGTFTVDDTMYSWNSDLTCSSSVSEEHLVQVTFTNGSNTTTTYLDTMFAGGAPTLRLYDASLASVLYQTAPGAATGAALYC